jgi:hypothetical protein
VSETTAPPLLQLAELKAMLRQMTLAALKLPQSDERREHLRTIGRFRQRLDALKREAFARAVMLDFKRSA